MHRLPNFPLTVVSFMSELKDKGSRVIYPQMHIQRNLVYILKVGFTLAYYYYFAPCSICINNRDT